VGYFRGEIKLILHSDSANCYIPISRQKVKVCPESYFSNENPFQSTITALHLLKHDPNKEWGGIVAEVQIPSMEKQHNEMLAPFIKFNSPVEPIREEYQENETDVSLYFYNKAKKI